MEYHGQHFSGVNKPTRTPEGPKKFKVLASFNGQKKIVRFGDPQLSIKSHIPERKKSYCARSSGQGNTKNKLSANYWSRKQWHCGQ